MEHPHQGKTQPKSELQPEKSRGQSHSPEDARPVERPEMWKRQTLPEGNKVIRVTRWAGKQVPWTDTSSDDFNPKTMGSDERFKPSATVLSLERGPCMLMWHNGAAKQNKCGAGHRVRGRWTTPSKKPSRTASCHAGKQNAGRMCTGDRQCDSPDKSELSPQLPGRDECLRADGSNHWNRAESSAAEN